MKFSALVCVCMLVLVKTAVGLFDDGCRYEYRVAADKCIRANLGLQQKVDHLDSMMVRSTARLNAVTQAYTEEFNVLAKDTGSLKTVTNMLVEDSVQIQGKLRILQDVGVDVRNLRNTVTNENKMMTDMISGVAGRLDREVATQTANAEKLIKQEKENTDSLKEMQSKITQLEEKLSKVGTGTSTNNSGSSGTEALEGKLAELQAKLEGNIEFFNGQVDAIIANVKQIQQQMQSKK